MAITDKVISKLSGVYKKLNITSESIGETFLDNVRKIIVSTIAMTVISALSLSFQFLRNSEPTPALPAGGRDPARLLTPPPSLERPSSRTEESIDPILFLVQTEPVIAIMGLALFLFLTSAVVLFVVFRFHR